MRENDDQALVRLCSAHPGAPPLPAPGPTRRVRIAYMPHPLADLGRTLLILPVFHHLASLFGLLLHSPALRSESEACGRPGQTASRPLKAPEVLLSVASDCLAPGPPAHKSGKKPHPTGRTGSRSARDPDRLSTSALPLSLALASCLQGGSTTGATESVCFWSVLPIRLFRGNGRFLQQVSFHPTRALMHRRRRIRASPFFDSPRSFLRQRLPALLHALLLLLFSLSSHLLSLLPPSLQYVDAHSLWPCAFPRERNGLDPFL